MTTLTGKVAVITGGASERGIGRATGTLLAEHGAKVILADINRDQLHRTETELRERGHDVTGIPTDVADLSSMHALADAATDTYGRIDIVFLNAGIGGGGELLADDTDTWNRVIGINFHGVLNGIKAFVPRLIAQDSGHVLATTSPAGIAGTKFSSASYAATKAAMCSLMESLYGQLRADHSNIRTTVVAPPLARTNLAGDPATMDAVADYLKNLGVPPGLTEPEDVAALVLDAINDGRFWATLTPDTNKRIFDNRLTDVTTWQTGMIHAKAESLANGTAPDAFIWG